jgi:(p)ppGpp synthase/HD superfamily hydrolase
MFNFNTAPHQEYLQIKNREAGLVFAEFVATTAHVNQVDKAGHPYIEHPCAVERLVQQIPSYIHLTSSEQYSARIAAFLHDVLEDTEITEKDLIETDIDPCAIEVVRLLTRKKKTEQDSYYDAVAIHRIAKIVKLADMAHNADPERLALLEEAMRDRLREKYRKGMMHITSDPNDQVWFRSKTHV